MRYEPFRNLLLSWITSSNILAFSVALSMSYFAWVNFYCRSNLISSFLFLWSFSMVLLALFDWDMSLRSLIFLFSNYLNSSFFSLELPTISCLFWISSLNSLSMSRSFFSRSSMALLSVSTSLVLLLRSNWSDLYSYCLINFSCLVLWISSLMLRMTLSFSHSFSNCWFVSFASSSPPSSTVYKAPAFILLSFVWLSLTFFLSLLHSSLTFSSSLSIVELLDLTGLSDV